MLIVILWWTGIAADFRLSFHLPQASLSGGQRLAFGLGIVLMIAGIALRQCSIVVLGKYFTSDVAAQSGHSLIEVGPYRYVHHPSYTGALLTLLGFGLALGNWAGLTAALGEPYRQ